MTRIRLILQFHISQHLTFYVSFNLFTDHLVLMTRNPFSLLVSMQLKQAALAANDYQADIFATEAWKNFATSGVKGGFQLLDLIITELKSHMARYNSMPLIG